jgi:hypothetical protein
MLKEQVLKAINIVNQTVPFLMITVTFIGLAYTCGQSISPFQMDPSFDLIRLSCHYAP